MIRVIFQTRNGTCFLYSSGTTPIYGDFEVSGSKHCKGGKLHCPDALSHFINNEVSCSFLECFKFDISIESENIGEDNMGIETPLECQVTVEKK